MPAWWSDIYNLQLYDYQEVASPHFAHNTCGNLWLDLYNACPLGGIGKCVAGVGEWSATVDAMTSCGLQDDPAALPWPNASNNYNGVPFYANHSRAEVLDDFCRCSALQPEQPPPTPSPLPHLSLNTPTPSLPTR